MTLSTDDLRLSVEGLGRKSPNAFDFYSEPISIWGVLRRDDLAMRDVGFGGGGGGGDDDDDDDDDDGDDEEAEVEPAGGEDDEVEPGRWSMHDVSFELKAGEAVGLVGGIGTGAKVLMRVVSGLLPPDAGRAVVVGRRSNATYHSMSLLLALLPVRAQVRALSQLAYIPRRQRRRWRRDLIETALRDEEGRVIVADASRRIAIAASVDPTADLLLIDDFPDEFDVTFRRRCEQRLETALAGGASAVISLADARAPRQYCRWAIRFENGTIAEVGEVERLLGHERTRADRVSRAGDSLRGFNADAAILGVREVGEDNSRVSILAEIEIASPDIELDPKLVLRDPEEGTTFFGSSQSLRCDEPGRYLLECAVVPPRTESGFTADLIVEIGAHGTRESIGRRSVATIVGTASVDDVDIMEPLGEDAGPLLDVEWRLQRA